MDRKVWRIPQAGNLGKLALREESLGELENGKVRVAVKAVGLNFADIFALVGLYSATPQGSFIPGLEFAGTVVETTSEDFAVGDDVMGVTRFGGYVSVIDADPAYCIALPQGWNYGQGAAYPAQTLTAWYALKTLGNIQPHHNVLVQSAAGGVGLQAMRICRKLGANAIGTVGNPAKIEFLAREGFTQVVARDRHFVANVRAMLGDGELHIALDAVGGKWQRDCYDLLAATGRLIVFGAAQFAPGKNRPRYGRMLYQFLRRPRYDPLQLVTDNKSVMGFNLIWLWERREELFPLLDQLREIDLAPPHVGREFSFTEARAAIDWLRSGQSVGKVVLVL